jgi:uncharacterized sporulation protein YeaH/YhbH (DUF444 family)
MLQQIIDRRLAGKNKSIGNRERFLRRYQGQLREAVRKAIDTRGIRDVEQGEDIRIPKRDITEPSFGHGPGGAREIVHPGNQEYVRGDRIERPQGGSGRGSGAGQAGDSGEGEDDFVFHLTKEEFMQIFFDDLELPNLVRTEIGRAEKFTSVRSGYAKSGTPANLAVIRTLSQSLARRIALGGGLSREMQEVEAKFIIACAAGHAEQAADLYGELDRLQRRRGGLPFIDEPDLRYRNRVLRPEPVSRAAMFCLMDVSASMDEDKKDLAKRFFTLLYLFLTRKYNEVELIFIRHTDDAEEVDENTFFHDTRTGGTVVLSALELADQIRRERFANGWNVYAAQASDGDAFGADPARSARFLREKLLPATRYYTYLELCSSQESDHSSTLWSEYGRVAESTPNFAMKRASDRNEIYPVFRELFRKEGN